MSENAPDRAEGWEYLRHLVHRQEAAGAAFLDLNVDEISLKPADQKAAMAWLVRTVQQMTRLPPAVDSSNIDVIRAGLEACDPAAARPMLNSASLERIEALDLARQHAARVVVTAAGGKGMPANAEERVANASRMVDAALAKGLALADIYVDPLIFPISVDKDYGLHSLDAIRSLRAAYGPDIHITGGMSNVSFGIPNRKIINDVFLILAIAAGADSGIIDPVTSRPDEVLRLDRGSRAYQLAEDVLLGRDEHCRLYLRAWRKGELKAAAAA
jgi:5-methyltetrahydrofolate--homocysteine methyltransferase